MTRAPFNVLVFPYRRVGDGRFEYALFKRTDAGFWQGVSGGGEDDETPLAAARRETWEETGIEIATGIFQLKTVEYVPVTEFSDSHLWGADVYVIPQYCFGALVDVGEIVLSSEHSEFRWLAYSAANSLLKYDGNKTALWELNQRLKDGKIG